MFLYHGAYVIVYSRSMKTINKEMSSHEINQNLIVKKNPNHSVSVSSFSKP